MKLLHAAVLLAVALALAAPARAAIDDAGCVTSLGDAFARCFDTHYTGSLKYTCYKEYCKETLGMVAQACIAEGYRLADQVLAAAKARQQYGSNVPTIATADNV